MKIYLNFSFGFFLSFLLNVYILSYRLEPINIIKQRENFYLQNFPKLTDKLKLNYSDKKGYSCTASSKISKNEIIFKIAKNNTYSVYDEFPLKHLIYKIIKKDEFVSKNKNILNNILLSVRLLFDSKANITEIFILTRKYGNSEELNYTLDSFRQYLRSRTDFASEYLKTLPLANFFGETSWSDDDITQYSQTGSLGLIKVELTKSYRSLINSLNKTEIVAEFIKNWLNEDNLSHFLSLYGNIASKSFKLRLGLNSKLNSKSINTKLEKLGGNTLIPFLDICSKHSLILDDLIDIAIDYENHDEIIILSKKEYEEGEEFSFNMQDKLSNDYLLVNYGEILKNNPNQEFFFKFDMIDKDYNFYNTLRSQGFSLNMISLPDNNKLSIKFPLTSEKLSKDLLQFIKIFLSIFKAQDEEKFKSMKSYQNMLSSIDTESFRSLKIYLLYYFTIEKNIKNILDTSEMNDLNSLYDFMIETKRKISKSNKIIQSNTEKFYQDRNLTSFSDDDFQNLFYFKTLHTLIKRDLIQEFNFENLKILFSHENNSLNNAMKILNRNINQIKKQYM